jgi:hypothetical protein
MTLELSLPSVPVQTWQTGQAIVFDWYDGPRSGVCSLAQPGGEFAFDLLAERANAEDLDDRLFRLKELAPGTVAQVLQLIQDLGQPANSVWVPVWKFSNPAARDRVEREIDQLLSQARTTPLVIATRDMAHFLGCWNLDRVGQNGKDWFAFLGVPSAEALALESQQSRS